MIKRLVDWWTARQRATDIDILWPTICEQADSEEQARAVFYVHAMHDPAWRRLGVPNLVRQIRELPYLPLDYPVEKREDQL